MAEAPADDTRGLVRAALATAAAFAVAGLVAVIFDRLGVPGFAIAALAVALFIGALAAVGLSAGTMRFVSFLTAGRNVGPTAASLAVGASSATVLPGSPGAAALGIALAALLWAGPLRASGMPGLAGWLGHRYGDPMVRLIASLCAGSLCVVLAASRMEDVAAVLSASFGLSRVAGTGVAAAAAIVVLLPGGAGAVIRAGLCCALVACAAAPLAVSAPNLLPVAREASTAGLSVLAVASAMLLPHLATGASVCRTTSDARGGLFGGAILVLVFGIILSVPANTPVLFNAIGQAILRIALDAAAMFALLHAAGMLLGYEMRGPLDRRRHPTSKRFAVLRVVLLLTIALATYASLNGSGDLPAWQETLGVLLVAAVGAPVLIGVLVAWAGRWAGILSSVGGLATAGLMLEGRLAPSADAETAALAGLVAGLAAGLVPALLMRRGSPPQPVDDGSL